MPISRLALLHELRPPPSSPLANVHYDTNITPVPFLLTPSDPPRSRHLHRELSAVVPTSPRRQLRVPHAVGVSPASRTISRAWLRRHKQHKRSTSRACRTTTNSSTPKHNTNIPHHLRHRAESRSVRLSTVCASFPTQDLSLPRHTDAHRTPCICS